jgi:hypothetical protein
VGYLLATYGQSLNSGGLAQPAKKFNRTVQLD